MGACFEYLGGWSCCGCGRPRSTLKIGELGLVCGCGVPSSFYVEVEDVLPGTVLAYAGQSVPSGYLHCNGQAVSRATYPDLFAAIGTTYGPGDGSTTFNVPDLEGQAIRGNAGAGDVGYKYGEASHTLAVQELPPHTHPLAGVWSSPGNINIAVAPGATMQAIPTTDSAGGGQPHNNIGPSMAMWYIIKT